VYLPQSTAPASWAVWDYDKRSARSTKGATGGSCTAQLPAVPDNELWFVDRLRVSCTSTASTVAKVYSSTLDDDGIEDGTLTGNFDVADNAAPILLKPTEQLTVVWTGATDGAIGRFRAQITVMRKDTA
jgi:hypothetical protein